MKVAFVTGASGFLGSHFVLNAMAQQTYDKLYLLVRGSYEGIRLEKVRKAFRAASGSYINPFDIDSVLDSCEIIQADINEKGCGLDLAQLKYVKGSNTVDFWHFAAALNFEDKSNQIVYEANVGGTHKVLSLIDALKVDKYFHVSTAYSCGNVSGHVKEDLHSLDRDFSNFYEQSKCEAEHKVVEFCDNKGIDWVIFRPSMIIGNSQTYKPGGATSGVYNLVNQIHAASNVLSANNKVTRICGDPEAMPNLVPVDQVVEIMLKLKTSGYTGIKHLASYSNPSYKFMLNELCKILNISDITVEIFEMSKSTVIEKIFAKAVGMYTDYFHRAQIFENAQQDKIHITPVAAVSYLLEAARQAKKETVNDLFDTKVISVDGSSVPVYFTGDSSKPVVIIVNAFLLPVEMTAEITKRLVKDFFVVTWVLEDYFKTDPNQVYIDDHVKVFNGVVKELALDNYSVVGWCTGVPVIMKALQENDSFNKIVFLNSSLYPQGYTGTEYEKNIYSACEKSSTDEKFANLLHGSLFLKRQEISSLQEDEISGLSYSMVNEVDISLMHLIYKPFESPKSVREHGKMCYGYCNDNINIEEALSKHKVLALTGDNDTVAAPIASEELSGKCGNVTTKVIKGANHFMLYNNNECIEMIESYLKT